MNYLAHLYLADGSPDSMVGHMLGDFVKGSVAGRFSPAITRGIVLHRHIDTYTDSHVLTRRSRERFSAGRRRFAGIAVDVCYDHFLCRHWSRFSVVELEAFVARSYAVLHAHEHLYPARLLHVLTNMTQEDWLSGYANLWFVGTVLDRLSLRLKRKNTLAGAVEEIERNYAALEEDFLGFFPQAIAFARRVNGRPAPHWRNAGSPGIDLKPTR